jgi:hypothetical protein
MGPLGNPVRFNLSSQINAQINKPWGGRESNRDSRNRLSASLPHHPQRNPVATIGRNLRRAPTASAEARISTESYELRFWRDGR